jgi:hypothetical protein
MAKTRSRYKSYEVIAEHSRRVVTSVYADLVRDGVLSPGSRLDNAASVKPGEEAGVLMEVNRKLNELHLARDHGNVTHDAVTLPSRSPSLAVSGFFSAGARTLGSGGVRSTSFRRTEST